MLKKRIIPCLDIKNGKVVKGINFINISEAGDPVEMAIRYYEEGADELVFLDITATDEKRKTLKELVKNIASEIRIPFTVGGGINCLDDIDILLNSGADKISINSSAIRNPSLIKEAADRFGSQAVVVAVDTKNFDDKKFIMINGGKIKTDKIAFDWCMEAFNNGAGELLITSMDHDGTGSGYDNGFLKKITSNVSIPVIASGGAGKLEDFYDSFDKADVDACLAASLFHYEIIKIKELKKYLKENGVTVRYD